MDVSPPTMRALDPEQRSRRRTPRRRGVVILEFILAFLILVILTVALIELSILAIVDSTVRTAAIEAAREFAKGATPTMVANRVDEILQIHAIDGVNVGTPDVRLILEDSSGVVADLGDNTIPCTPNGLSLAGTDNVRATVCLEVSGPVPDLLGTLGVSIAGRYFEISIEAEEEMP